MELGILEKDGIYFLETSEFAKRNLYYLHWGATYVCDSPYEVYRDSLDACILFYILEGSLEFNYRGQHFTAKKDQIVLLSGKYINHYYAKEKLKFYWFHFSGNATEEYIELLYRIRGSLFSAEISLQAKPYVKELMRFLKNGDKDEHMASFHIHGLFSYLVREHGYIQESDTIKEACRYLNEHYQESIPVANLAERFNLSKFHFSRMFKKEVGSSPHQYLLNRRLLSAKQLLANTNLSVEAIALDCGFNSTSHFIRAFKYVMDITPNQFRKMPF